MVSFKKNVICRFVTFGMIFGYLTLQLQSGNKAMSAPTASALIGETSADIGLVDALTQPKATHIFTLTNSSSVPLVLDSVRGTCGCEQLAFLVNNQRVNTETVAPGKTAQVKFDVNLQGQPSTELSKIAFVVGSKGNILDTLTLSFKVRQPFMVQPQHIDLGDIPAGGQKDALATVQVDSTLLPSGQFPTFISDTAGISAKQQGVVNKSERDGKPCLSANFVITVSHPTNMGTFAAMLRFSLATTSRTSETVYLPVSGNVVGDFAATPKSVNFGVVSAGQDSMRQLILIGTTADKIKAIKTSSPSQWVTATVNQSVDAANQNSVTLTVALSGKAPAGQLQTVVVLSSGASQNLTIPVSANVVGPQ